MTAINPNLLSIPVIANIINNDEGYMDENGYIVPHITAEYKTEHSTDKPFMLLPDEQCYNFESKGESSRKPFRYILTSYGRCFCINRNKFIHQVGKYNLNNMLAECFPEQLQNNNFTKANNLLLGHNKNYYSHRDKIIEKQKAYNALHKEHKAEYDKVRREKIKNNTLKPVNVRHSIY